MKEGDYILAVNGIPLTTSQEPFAAFQGLSDKTVEITYNSSPSMTGAKTAIVQTMSDEYRLRNLSWIEGMRKHVEEMASIHMNTIESLAIAIDAKDQTTHGHVRRTQIYASEMGKLFKVVAMHSGCGEGLLQPGPLYSASAHLIAEAPHQLPPVLDLDVRSEAHGLGFQRVGLIPASSEPGIELYVSVAPSSCSGD